MAKAERTGLSDMTLAACLSNEILHLILMPTEACNFRCVYCYEEFKYKRMEPWVVSGVKRLLARRAPGLKRLSIGWFGGEPLLAKDVMVDVMEHVATLSSQNPTLSVASDATTNGYLLTPSLASKLIALGITRYQVSFDGPQAWHDRKRVLAGGKGTFHRIWGNLLALRELTFDFKVTIRLHVDRQNGDAMRAFVDECAQAFAGDPRYELFIRGLSRLGGPSDRLLQVFEHGEGETTFEALKAYGRSRNLAVMAFTPEDSVCYAARANSYVVRANGRLNKCTVALEHPNNQVGVLCEDGTMQVDSPKVITWMRGLRSKDSVELKCPMKGLAESESSESHLPGPSP